MNPYESLPPEAFWSSAVARRSMLDIADLWTSPFPISRETRISTYGSCFAQHFSRALRSRGYTWLNAELAPSGLSGEGALRFNYGVFSSRTGNIYTASLLLQWCEWALGSAPVPSSFWTRGGRIFDPFRPNIEPDGFGSVEEMLASRAHAISALRKSLLGCDLLVFTLGLTESWWDVRDKVEYATCPGTRAGQFDSGQHQFLNQDYGFVRDRLEKAISLLRQVRGDQLPVLLTVSPVPLVATNSGNHVLVATTGSKAVLRAVAGDVASKVAAVSYFPSYEIISSPVFKGAFFDDNLRTVSRRGVAHVMDCFFAGLGQGSAGLASATAEAGTVDHAAPSDEDVLCDEELLAAFGPRK